MYPGRTNIYGRCNLCSEYVDHRPSQCIRAKTENTVPPLGTECVMLTVFNDQSRTALGLYGDNAKCSALPNGEWRVQSFFTLRDTSLPVVQFSAAFIMASHVS